jgi:hypothetical protein
MELVMETVTEMVSRLELAKVLVSGRQFAIVTLQLWLRRVREVASQIGVDPR